VNSEIAEIEQAVAHLSLDAAIREAEAFLADGQRYRVTRREVVPGDPKRLDLLGPVTRSFFESIESLEEVRGETRIDRRFIQRSAYNLDYVQIGSGFDLTHLVVQPQQDVVFELDGSEDEPESPGYPTIYHWLVYADRVARLGAKDERAKG
jgi:hypothetical protein